jgi:hypothetical protein
MGFLHKFLHAGLVWLTAAMTLIAATPRDVCACRALANYPSGSLCCCPAGESPANSTKGPGAKPHSRKPRKACCCCEAKSEHSCPPLRADCQARQLPCIRSMVQAEFLIPSTTDTSVSKDVTDNLVLLPQSSSPALFRGVSEHGRRVWLLHLSSPPTDLVISLQHFII